jgi:hypothetical protein
MKTSEQMTYSMIEWMNSVAKKITDYTVGSVVRTMFESVAREIEEIYYRTYTGLSDAQTEGVYTAFDFPKKGASKASGTVTFYKTAPDNVKDYVIGLGTRVFTTQMDTQSSVSFSTIDTGTIYSKTGITESLTYTEDIVDSSLNVLTKLAQRFIYQITSIQSNFHTYTNGVDYVLNKNDSGDTIKWLVGNQKPLVGKFMTVQYIPLSVEIPVECLTSGTVGNVSVGQISNISTLIPGVPYVNNFSSILTGTDEETVENRKVRFSHFIDSLSRGTLASVRYAIFNKTTAYQVYSASILENVPIPGFLKIYVSDSTGTAPSGMLTDVATTVEDYRGVGIVVSVSSPSPLLVDVYCKLRIKDGYDKDQLVTDVYTALSDHLSSYKLLNDDGYSTVYLTSFDYVVKSVNSTAILEADISFARTTDGDPGNAVTKKIDDIAPRLTASIAEIIRPGTITVSYY